MENNQFGDELADAIRKSWSQQAQGDLNTFGNVIETGESPIGTPLNEPDFGEERGSPFEQQHHNQSDINHSHNSANEQDYQLFKHHYSIADNNRDSVADILNDLDLGSPEPGPPMASDLMYSGVNNNSSNNSSNNNQYSRRVSEARQPMNTRRSSVQDVQWIRQLLNPRSSFSGASANEPSVPAPTSNCDKCWVTTLLDDSTESIKSMIVLYQSLQMTGSRYPLYILHSNNLDISQLSKFDINTIGISSDLLNSERIIGDRKRFILSLFVSFVDKFDLICYISPSCMVMDSIDELLDCDEILDEIDNETCVLLTNVLETSTEPQLIILKPNKEVAMCIREFFTVYDSNDVHKIEKLRQMSDLDILKQLFGDTWGQVSSEGYVTLLDANNYIRKSYPKIVDFKQVKPWNMQGLSNDQTICGKWYAVWLAFWNTHRH